MPASPFIFERYLAREDHTYKVLRRADRVHMGFVEMDCAREWGLRDLNFDVHDYVEGQGSYSYRTRERAAEVLQADFEAGKVAPAKPRSKDEWKPDWV